MIVYLVCVNVLYLHDSAVSSPDYRLTPLTVPIQRKIRIERTIRSVPQPTSGARSLWSTTSRMKWSPKGAPLIHLERVRSSVVGTLDSPGCPIVRSIQLNPGALLSGSALLPAFLCSIDRYARERTSLQSPAQRGFRRISMDPSGCLKL